MLFCYHSYNSLRSFPKKLPVIPAAAFAVSSKKTACYPCSSSSSSSREKDAPPLPLPDRI